CVVTGGTLPYNPPETSRPANAGTGDRLMPWSNQTGGGGGPWGSGSRGPWGSGPQPSGGGSRPPDLEEFLRRGQDRLRNFMPGNLGGRGIGLIVLAAIA